MQQNVAQNNKCKIYKLVKRCWTAPKSFSLSISALLARK